MACARIDFEAQVLRARFIEDWPGGPLIALGLELAIVVDGEIGKPFQLRLTDCDPEEWERGIWLPWREV